MIGPPLYYEILGVWQSWVGIHPLVVRMSSVLISIVGVALLYRTVRELSGSDTAGLLSALVFAVLPYNVATGIILRGYVVLVALTPLSLWLTICYFRRPAFWRGLSLALCMVAMFYTHPTAVMVFAMLGILSLILSPRHIWRWWLPFVIAFPLALPEIITKWQLAVSRVAATQQIRLLPLPEAFAEVFNDLVIGVIPPWLAITLIGFVGFCMLWFYADGKMRRTILFFGLWLLSTLFLYYTNGFHNFFSTRYLSWFMPGFVAMIGIGFAALPRWVVQLALVGLLILATVIAPEKTSYLRDQFPFDTVFTSMKAVMRPEDRMMIDPNLTDPHPEEWEYFTRVHFPNGLPLVAQAGNQRRIWYATLDGASDAETYAAVVNQRLPATYFGPWNFFFRLYEAPPDVQGMLYDNGLRFHGAEIINATEGDYALYREAETVRIKQWWSVDAPVAADYSLGTYVLGKGNTLLSEFNGAPPVLGGPTATSQWQLGQYYVAEFDLVLPDPMRTGWYPIQQAIYQWWDGQRIPIEGANDQNLLEIARFYMKSW